MLSTTLKLLKNHGGLLAICFSLLFFSVFGQSIFFGLYLPEIQEALNLTKTKLGSLYAVATIMSSVIVLYTGRKLDVWPLRNFVTFTLIGLAVGCFAMSFSTNLVVLFLAFLLLRHFGQGLMSISSNATINRYLDENRGKATAITGLGAPMQLVVFPFLVYFLADYIEWRTAWMAYGFFILAVLLPAFWLFLRTHQKTTHARWAENIKNEQSADSVNMARRHWTAAEVLRDWRIYGIIAIMVIAPFAGTVVFFYQADLAASLGLTSVMFATSFVFMTVAKIIFGLTAGEIIDRYGEKPALTLYPILFALGLFCLINGQNIWLLYLSMALIGMATGFMSTIGGPLLAQMYGTKNLSSVKSILFSSAIVASALSPFLFGYFMDRGVSILTLFGYVIVYAAVIWVLAFPICAYKK